MSRSATRLLPLLAFLALPGCWRAMEVSSEPSPVFSIIVHNDLAEAMIVSYNDGRGDAMLGRVDAGRSERFIIAAPASRALAVRAVSASGGRTSGPHQVQLSADTPQTVRLR